MTICCSSYYNAINRLSSYIKKETQALTSFIQLIICISMFVCCDNSVAWQTLAIQVKSCYQQFAAAICCSRLWAARYRGRCCSELVIIHLSDALQTNSSTSNTRRALEDMFNLVIKKIDCLLWRRTSGYYFIRNNSGSHSSGV